MPYCREDELVKHVDELEQEIANLKAELKAAEGEIRDLLTELMEVERY